MIWMNVDAALSEVPINAMPLVDDGDFKSREESVVFNQAGLDLVWNFVTAAGAFTQTAVTPTDTAGNYDWVNQGNGMYSIEIPASGGASINNDTEGFGWFTGFATGILPWAGPIIGFRSALLNNSLVTGSASLPVDVLALNGGTAAAANLRRSAESMYYGSVTGAATTTTLIDSGLTQTEVDHWKGRIVIFLTGTLAKQATDITEFDPTTDKLTFTALSSAPSGGDTYVIV
jgi:hypothetical protein